MTGQTEAPVRSATYQFVNRHSSQVLATRVLPRHTDLMVQEVLEAWCRITRRLVNTVYWRQVPLCKLPNQELPSDVDN